MAVDTSGRKKASDFPQELLDIFHHYVHGDLDRRGFLEKAQKFAVGGVTAAALLEALQPNFAWAEQVPKDDSRIKASRETVQSPQGNGSIKGYFAKPANASGKLPGIIVCHENRGLNPYIEDVARRLALLNYVAFAPDGLTSVGGYPGEEQKAAELFRNVDRAKMLEDFVAAAHWLKGREECTGKIGAIGFCFGGGMVNNLAVKLGSDLSAGVAFYPAAQPMTPEEVGKIKAPLLENYAALDTRITGRWPEFEKALKGAGVSVTGYIYEGVNHGFHNDTTPRYDENAAKLAWQRSVDFFNKNLRG
jgi:carboxymethylenebutenolidase